jgi:hypothetical protein
MPTNQRFLLTVLLGSVVAPNTQADDPKRSPSLRFEGYEDNNRTAVFCFCNPTDKPIFYAGYPNSPLEDWERHLAGKWTKVGFLECATGLERHELKARGKLRLKVRLADVRNSRPGPPFSDRVPEDLLTAEHLRWFRISLASSEKKEGLFTRIASEAVSLKPPTSPEP